MQNQVSKFEKYFHDYDVKRHRAILKYQEEVRLNVLKKIELSRLHIEEKALRKRFETFSFKI